MEKGVIQHCLFSTRRSEPGGEGTRLDSAPRPVDSPEGVRRRSRSPARRETPPLKIPILPLPSADSML